MEKGGDRSVDITGPVTNSPISSGEFHGPVTYDYSKNKTIINFNFSSSKEIQSLQQIKKTSEKEFQIQASSNTGGEKTENLQDLNSMEAVTKMISDVVRNTEKDTGK